MQPKVPIDVKPITIVKRGGTQHPLDLVNRKAAYDDEIFCRWRELEGELGKSG